MLIISRRTRGCLDFTCFLWCSAKSLSAFGISDFSFCHRLFLTATRESLCFLGLIWLDLLHLNIPEKSSYFKVHNLNYICKISFSMQCKIFTGSKDWGIGISGGCILPMIICFIPKDPHLSQTKSILLIQVSSY